jgi:RNA polymerase sigma factor (sigma-70 family)
MTEQKAIEGCKKQDRISQKYIFDEYSDGMLMLCMRYVKRLPDAEELMLNGFYNFFKTIDRLVYNGNTIGGWLKKIMVNECLMFLRKREGFKLIEEEHAVDIGADDDLIGRMNANDIFQLIMKLPIGYRTVFNLFVVEGYSHKEIAGMLDISVGTSKSQLNKAKVMMQKVMQEKGNCYEK